jgi:nucleoside-diphosphate-sugar epimerase
MGHNRLPVTSIGSVTAGLLLAATEDAAAGRIYNVAQDEEMSQRVFFAALARAANVRSRMIPVPATLLDKAGLIAEIIGNILPGFQPPLSRNVVALLGLDAQFPTSRIREELGWLPAAPIPDVLRDALL